MAPDDHMHGVYSPSPSPQKDKENNMPEGDIDASTDDEHARRTTRRNKSRRNIPKKGEDIKGGARVGTKRGADDNDAEEPREKKVKVSWSSLDRAYDITDDEYWELAVVSFITHLHVSHRSSHHLSYDE